MLAADPHTYPSHEPVFLVFSDTEAGGSAASRAVEASGGRVAAVLGIADSRERRDRQAALDGICVDLSRDHGAEGSELLGWVRHVAARDHAVATVACPLELVDMVDARLDRCGAEILVSPDLADRVTALSMSWLARPGLGVSDVSREVDNVRLRRLADEVSRIARSLSSLSAQSQPPGGYAGALQAQLADAQLGFSPEPATLAPPPMPGVDEVRKLIRMRRLRDSFFDAALFADPAWDMLLDLFAARIDGDQVAVSSLCIAAAVPPTTALRWIKTMTDHGIFERHADPNDGRRIFIRLAEQPTRAMAEYFQAVRRFEGVAI